MWPWESEFGREVNLLFVEGSMWMRCEFLSLYISRYSYKTIYCSLMKRGLKMLADKKRFKAAIRPPNEQFQRGIYYGGFPSGHLSQAGYAITLYYLAYNATFITSPVLIGKSFTAELFVLSNKYISFMKRWWYMRAWQQCGLWYRIGIISVKWLED